MTVSALPLPNRWSARRPSRVASAGESSVERLRLVVIGNGMVGQRFCERLAALEAHRRFCVTVLGEEHVPAYDRVHLTDVWRGRRPGELLLRHADWYSAHGIELKLGRRVRELEREARRVLTEDGETYGYDRLVLATGSRAAKLPIPVDDGVRVLDYRTLEDAERILAEVRGRRRVIVIGAGLLGLEAARSLQQLGCDVVVLEASSQLLPRQLDAEAAMVVERALRAAGLVIATRSSIVRIRSSGTGVRVELERGAAVEGETIVAAVGARACDAIARAAGLRCDARGGVCIDARLCTNDPNIFAIGECAHHAEVPHGLVAPGYAMAELLAHNLLGGNRRLSPQQAVTRLKLDLAEVTVLGNPLASQTGKDAVWRDGDKYRRLVIDRKRLIAAIAVGAWDELPAVQRLLSSGRRIGRGRVQRFLDAGCLALDQGSPSVAAWADSMVVCQCASVDCGTLRRAVSAGAKDPERLGQATSAGTLCGSCRPLLATLCGLAQSAPPQTSNRGLRAAAFATMALGAATLLFPAVPLARSVLEQGVDLLWIDPFNKQVTGFSLIALMALGLSLSLRKRITRFELGAYPLWRFAHAALGTAGIAALFGHTGFRLGHNYDRWVMTAFLMTALTGAIAALFLTRAAQAAPVSRFARAGAALRKAHDYAVWPLAVLVGFHVLKVYYF